MLFLCLFPCTTAELSSCSKDHLVQTRLKHLSSCPSQKSLPNFVLDENLPRLEHWWLKQNHGGKWSTPLTPAFREVGSYLWMQGQPGRQVEFQTSQDYTPRPWLKNKQIQNPSKKSWGREIVQWYRSLPTFCKSLDLTISSAISKLTNKEK